MRSPARQAGFVLAGAAVVFATPAIALGHGAQAPDPTLSGLLTAWSGEPLPWAVALLAAAAYLIAVRSVNRAHPRSRIASWRIAVWLAGCGTLLVALASSIDVYAADLLSVHMVQHLLLAMVAPPLLALGAPVTLVLRAARPRWRNALLLPILHSRLVRLIAHPLVAWSAFTVVMFATHFSPIYNAALESPGLHLLEHAVYVGTGMLFWWPVVASDPIPWRMGYLARLVYVVAQMPVNAAVGLAIYFAPHVLYAHYATLIRTWGPDALTDQQLGGGVMWAGGDLILLLVAPMVVAAWMQADERRGRAFDAQRRARSVAASAGVDVQ